MQIAATLIIFVATLALVLLRPKGLSEAWFTVGGAILMLLLKLETPAQAIQTVIESKDALLFLVGLLVLAELMRESGFFDVASAYVARMANGNGPALFRNVFVLGALVTAFMSLDTTAVMLTPVVMATAIRLKIKPLPFLFACAFVANTGSLLLEMSNLTNLLFAGEFHWNFAEFTEWTLLPQLLVLIVNFLVFRQIFRETLPRSFSVDNLAEVQNLIPDLIFYRCALICFVLVVIGYFVGSTFSIPPYVFALAGAGLLFGIGRGRHKIEFSFLSQVSWEIFPFVIGLFVVVGGLENIGLSEFASHVFQSCSHSKPLTVFAGVFGAGLGSNLINNVPMALVAISSLKHSSDLSRYSAVVGCNLGPNLTVAGSLATMLVLTSARKYGVNVSAKEFLRVGLITTPILLSVGALGIFASGVFLK